jgi:phosphoglucomutase
MASSQFAIKQIKSQPYSDQHSGTAGLRKKVSVFQQPHYLENFVQSIFDTLDFTDNTRLVLGGDGRFYNDVAIQTIAKIAAANGISTLYVGQNGLLSTPAASHLIRCTKAAGGIILTASHNPGGPDGDFGIKWNIASGGQATEQLTEAVYERSKQIASYRICELPTLDLNRIGSQRFGEFCVEVVDPVTEYAELMEQLFDFELIQAHLKKRIQLRFDAMNAVTGPYAQQIFCNMLGAPPTSILNTTPLADFGGLHPDPNPTDAREIVAAAMSESATGLYAASDGDGDRNMILGPGMLVSPGDSLAIMLANTVVVPGYRSGVPGVARSMPTSRAVDAVAADLGIPCHETPTGWRFFSNLLESGHIGLCGEESFGTSSAHAREKDGLWAILYWLNMLAALEQPVTDIVTRHWARYGRSYFQRRDYFIADTDQAQSLMGTLQSSVNDLPGSSLGTAANINFADEFSYTDPVDGSVSEHQGIRIITSSGGRIVFRLSGTGTSGATLRVYLDKTESEVSRQAVAPAQALAELGTVAAELARIKHYTSLDEPTATI